MNKNIHSDGAIIFISKKKKTSINQKENQLLLAMKMFLILLAISLQVSAAALSQEITLTAKKAPLREVMQAVRKQSGYQFIIESSYLDIAKPVSVDLKSTPVKDALDKIFQDQPFGYIVTKRIIIANDRSEENKPDNSQKQSRIYLRGKVTDSTGRPLRKATIRVEGNKELATFTDDNGEFVIKDAPSSGILIISMIGFESKEIQFQSNSIISIILKQSSSILDAVQVIGYGITTKRLSTGNISSVKSEVISQQNVTNPLLALSGRAAGLQITQTNGLPGSPVIVRIRGKNSISANNTPLYIIDGVPFNSQPIELIGGPAVASGIDGSTLGSPLNTINPSDIESIEILKDADATAIYGSRASNGVILITTKQNFGQKSTLEIDIKSGIGKITRYPKTLNIEQYLKFRADAFANSNITPTAANAPDLKVFDPNANFDWQKWLIGNTSQQQDANMTFKGGNVQTSFLLSGSFHNENTVRSSSDNYKRGSFHLNTNHSSIDKKFHLISNLFYSSDNSKLQGSSLLSSVATAVPNYPIYDENGDFTWPAGAHNNYVAQSTAYYKAQTNNLLGNVTLNYKIIPELNVKINIGYNRIGIDQINATPSTYYNPVNKIKGSSSFGHQYTQSIITEPLITYSKLFGKNRIEILVGGTLQNDKTRGMKFSLGNYENDQQLESIDLGSVTTKTGNIVDYKYISLFSRINYNWQDRYIINVSFRRDGSSRFGPGKQFGNFGSIGGAWIFSDEDWVKRQLSWLSYGKLRGSYGTTGNDGIPDYGYLSLYSPGSMYGDGNTLLPSQIANANYSWEINKKLEFAMELGFLRDRILFNTSWYRNRSGNQLVGFNLPSTTGFSSYQANLPALVQNKGWEFELNTINLKDGNINWSTSLNITIPKNKLISFPGLDKSSYANMYIEGKSINIIQGFHFLGINQDNGVAAVEDLNGDGIYTRLSSSNNQGGDYIVIGNTDPNWYAGINNSINYKRLELQVFFQYTSQEGYNLIRQIGGFGLGNTWTTFADYWRQPGDITSTPKPFSTVNINTVNYAVSDATVSNTSFLRLKTLSLSYILPISSHNIGVKSLRAYVQGQNILTFTGYKGYDPEQTSASATLAIPPIKMLTIGLQASL